MSERYRISNPIISVLCIGEVILLFIKTIQGKETETGLESTNGIIFTLICIFIILLAQIIVIFCQILLNRHTTIQTVISNINYFCFFFDIFLLRKIFLNIFNVNADIIKFTLFISFLLQSIWVLFELIDFIGAWFCNIAIIILTTIINSTVKNWWDDDIWNTVMSDILQVSLIAFSFKVMKSSRSVFYFGQYYDDFSITDENKLSIIKSGFIKMSYDTITYINNFGAEILVKSGLLRFEEIKNKSYGEKTKMILSKLFDEIHSSRMEQSERTDKKSISVKESEQRIPTNTNDNIYNSQKLPQDVCIQITEENRLCPMENLKKELKEYSSTYTYIGKGKLKQEISEEIFWFELYGRKYKESKHDNYEFLLKQVYHDQILKEKNKEIHDITVGLSKYVHEFKNPLMCLNAMITEESSEKDRDKDKNKSNCKDKCYDKEQGDQGKERRSMIKALSEFLMLQVINLDTFTQAHLHKIEHGGSNSPPTAHIFKLEDLLNFVSMIAKALIKRNDKQFDIKFVIDCQNVPDVINTFETKLKQILINLISNAIKFTQKGKITLTVTREKDNNDDLKFIVTDTGNGIAEDKKSTLFECFSKAKDTGRNNEYGAGLGLSICKELSNDLGTEIGFDSKIGKGTSFWFSIKAPDDCNSKSTLLCDNRPLESEKQIQSTNSLESKMRKKFNIAICDDDYQTLKAAKTTILDYGKRYNLDINVIDETDGLQVLSKIFELNHHNNKRKESIDFVISDENMVAYNGRQTARKLRKLEKKLQMKPIQYFLPLDHLSSEDSKDIIDGYFSKPLKMDELDRLFNIHNEIQLRTNNIASN